jgi:hypothetical protein
MFTMPTRSSPIWKIWSQNWNDDETDLRATAICDNYESKCLKTSKTQNHGSPSMQNHHSIIL